MARGLNKVMLIGRLGADPEIRYTPDGTPVANFSLATDSPIKKGDQWETETEWHRIVAWRRLAEI
jgi:single-strand DNA-binding protein